MSRDSYDQIAAVYATDMGQSMAFDDIGYYRALCKTRGGPVLELGCGTGRILLPLLQSGIDIDGIDQSEGMLAELRRLGAEHGLHPQVAQGSLQNFRCERKYSTILCPYSVVTYLTRAVEFDNALTLIKQALLPSGLLVLDTFIPRDVVAFNDFRLDYRRPHAGFTLQREKRIAREGECNRIERRYTLLRSDGKVERSWTTCDVIRPYKQQELVVLAHKHGFKSGEIVYDFGQANSNPQFVTLHFHL